METKKSTKTQRPVISRKQITDTTLSQIGKDISGFLDLMFENPLESEKFRQIYIQKKSLCSLHAANEEMSIHFSIEFTGKKGGGQ